MREAYPASRYELSSASHPIFHIPRLDRRYSMIAVLRQRFWYISNTDQARLRAFLPRPDPLLRVVQADQAEPSIPCPNDQPLRALALIHSVLLREVRNAY